MTATWLELGAEDLYATKAKVAEDIAAAESEVFTSAVTSANSYTDTKYAEATAYTDQQVAALSISDYALSADVDSLVADVSASTVSALVGNEDDDRSLDTIYGAKNYAEWAAENYYHDA